HRPAFRRPDHPALRPPAGGALPGLRPAAGLLNGRPMRIAVLGTSGSGKTTFARRLAGAVGAPHVELDAINWQPGWRDLNTHDLHDRRPRTTERAPCEAWVSDGNYRKLLDLVFARATHLVWLDYPRWLTMVRVFRRSFARAITGEELWPGTGNREDFARWL